MDFTSSARMDDPDVIRTVAHPARMAILDFLSAGPATATECSSTAGESPSACSYHLRTLAKLGFVEEVPSEDRRKRRWRLVVRGHGVPKSAQDSDEVRVATRAWGAQWVAMEQRILAQYIATEADEPKVWQKAATFSSAELHLTPDEVIELGQRIDALLEPFLDREDPAHRPPRTRPVRVVLTAFPRPRNPRPGPRNPRRR